MGGKNEGTSHGYAPLGGGGEIVNTDTALAPFDLSKINMQQLAKDLADHMQQPQPKTFWGKWWQNKKLPMDIDRISMFTELVQRAIVLNDSVTEMQYKLYIQPDMLNDLISGYKEDARRKMEIAIAEHQNTLAAIADQQTKRHLENQRLAAEIDKLKADGMEAFAKATLIKKIVETISIDKLPDHVKGYIISSLINPEKPITDELAMLDELKGLFIRNKTAMVEQSEAAALSARSKSLIDVEKSKNSVRKFKEIYPKSKKDND